MSSPALLPLTLSGFEVRPAMNEGTFELSLRGNADMTVSSSLGRYLKEVDTKARRDGVRIVHVRLSDLYFVSSSCFQAIAAWLLSVAARNAADRYTVRFETHAAHGWQRRSLEAIRRVAPDVVVVI
jgi:hypothetical protein